MSMKKHRTLNLTVLITAAALLAAAAQAQTPVGSAFTFQGQVRLAGSPLTDSADFDFTLWDAAVDGNMIGSPFPVNNVMVANGLFTVQLDFGVLAFNGDARWIEMAIRSPTGVGEFDTLSPRPEITPVPYATRTRGISVNELGAVGIGTTTPGSPLDVRSSSLLYSILGRNSNPTGTGIHGYAIAESGINYGVYGRTLSADGYAGYFEGGRNYFEGNVGIGTTTPIYPLHVETDIGTAIRGTTSGATGVAVYGYATGGGGNYGVYGRTVSPDGTGVYGYSGATSGTGVGVRGFSQGGVGVFGSSHGPDSRAVYGSSSGGFAGYFSGKGYFSRSVGIGTESPAARLHVTSASTATGLFQNSAFRGVGVRGEGYVGVWGSGPGGAGTGVYGESGENGDGVYGESSGDGSGVYGRCTGSDNSGVGVTGRSSGSTGRGVFGWASATAGNVNYGVYGKTSSAVGFAGYFTGGRNYFQGPTGINYRPGNLVNPRALFDGGSAMLTIQGHHVLDSVLRVKSSEGSGTDRFRVFESGHTVIGQLNYHLGATPEFLLTVLGSAGKPGGGSWSNSSDRRLKKNIEDLDGSLDRLMKLRGVTFEFKDPDSVNELHGTRIGMIAQEVEEIFPDWVDEGGNGYKTLTFRGFEALAVEAMRELRAEKDAEIAAQQE